MDSFDLSMNFRIIHTRQSAAKVSSLVEELGVDRVLMVTDPGIQALGLDQPLVKALKEQDIALSLFGQVEPNPTVDNVEQGLAQAQELKPQLLVALGGGSAMDCTKAINILFNRGGGSRIMPTRCPEARPCCPWSPSRPRPAPEAKFRPFCSSPIMKATLK